MKKAMVVMKINNEIDALYDLADDMANEGHEEQRKIVMSIANKIGEALDYINVSIEDFGEITEGELYHVCRKLPRARDHEQDR